MPLLQLTLIKRDLKDKLLGLLFTICVMGFVIVLGLTFYPKVASSGIGTAIQEMLEAFPKEMLERFHVSSIPDLSSFPIYFSLILSVLFLAMCIYACYQGASAAVRDESDHNAVLYFAQPVSRESAILSHYAARLMILFLLNSGLFLISYVGADSVVKMEDLFSTLLRVFWLLYLVEVLYFSVCFLISAFLYHVSQAPAAAFGLFLGSFVVGVLGSIVEKLNFLKWFSPYYYFPISDLMRPDFSAPTSVIVIILSVSAVSAAVCCLWYRRKDLNL